MLYLIAAYWPFVVIAILTGIGIGWWYRDPRGVDDETAWLERGPDEP